MKAAREKSGTRNRRSGTIASGTFQLVLENSDHPTLMREFYFSTDLRRDGYAEAVVQLEYLIDKIAASITETVEKQMLDGSG